MSHEHSHQQSYQEAFDQATTRLLLSKSLQEALSNQGAVQPEHQQTIVEKALNRAIFRAQVTGEDPLSLPEKRGFLHHISPETIIELTNHTGLAAAYINSLSQSPGENR